MRNDSWAPYGAAAGAVAVILFAVGYLIAPTPPDIGASPDEIAAYFGEDRTGNHVAVGFIAASVPFFIWWLATIASLTRAGGPGTRRAGAVAYGCGIVAVTLFLADTTALAVGTLRPENMAASPELATALFDFSWLALGVGSLVFAGVFAAFAVLVLRDKALWPDWLGWAAVAVALLTALRLGSVFTTDGAFRTVEGAFGFWLPVGAFALWTLVASVALASSVRNTPEPGGLFGPVSGALNRVRETLPGGGSG